MRMPRAARPSQASGSGTKLNFRLPRAGQDRRPGDRSRRPPARPPFWTKAALRARAPRTPHKFILTTTYSSCMHSNISYNYFLRLQGLPLAPSNVAFWLPPPCAMQRFSKMEMYDPLMLKLYYHIATFGSF